MTPETITQIPLEQLHESPFNPRKVFKGLDELAASIKAEGRVHEPLLVRPRVIHMLKDHSDPGTEDGYEIVFGHRRLRAAEQAGLVTVPCMVRAMSDAEARSAQTAENLQREDVHPIEEAEGFQSMIQFDGVSADELAELVGKSRSHVYGRLKLLQACPEVRQACLEGRIGSEVALLIARLRTPELQAKALAKIRSQRHDSDLEDGGKASFRTIRDLLVDEFTLQFDGAIFEPEDAGLVPDVGACSACPKRAGNAPEYADVVDDERAKAQWRRRGGADVCTDPDCWAAKKSAHLKREAAKLQDSGKVVVTGNAARAAISSDGKVKGAYVSLKDVTASLKKVSKSGTSVPVVNIQNPRTGGVVKAVRRADLTAAGIEIEAPNQRSGQSRDWEAERKARDAAEAAEQSRRRELQGRVRIGMVAAAPSTDELRLIVALVLKYIDWEIEERVCKAYGMDVSRGYDVRQQLKPLTANQLRSLLLDMVLEEGCAVEAYEPERGREFLHWAASVYGIDPDAAEPAPTPSPAGASANKGGAGAAKKKAPATPAVRYRDAATGSTWSGRGLQPAWIKAALARGAKLADFDTKASPAAAGDSYNSAASAARLSTSPGSLRPPP